MATTTPSDLLTLAEVADRCRCSIATIRRWINNGVLPRIRLPGGTYRVRRSALEAMLEGEVIDGS